MDVFTLSPLDMESFVIGDSQRSPPTPPSSVCSFSSTSKKRTKKEQNGRVTVSCIPCAQSKIKCDELRPCSRCKHRGTESGCIDKKHRTRKKRRGSMASSMTCSTSLCSSSGLDSGSSSGLDVSLDSFQTNLGKIDLLPTQVFNTQDNMDLISPFFEDDFTSPEYMDAWKSFDLDYPLDILGDETSSPMKPRPTPQSLISDEFSHAIVPESIIHSILKFHKRFNPQTTKHLILQSPHRWSGFLRFARGFLDEKTFDKLKSTLFHYALTVCHSEREISSLQKEYLKSPGYDTALFIPSASKKVIQLTEHEQEYLLKAYTPEELVNGEISLCKMSINITESKEYQIIFQTNETFENVVGLDAESLLHASISHELCQSPRAPKEAPFLYQLISPGVWKSCVHAGLASWFSGTYPQTYQLTSPNTYSDGKDGFPYLIDREGNHIRTENSVCITDSRPGVNYPTSLLLATKVLRE